MAAGDSASFAHMRTEIETRDGKCPSYVYKPEGDGPWPAVLVLMDGIGIRPAMFELCERIAKMGYFVLAPDLFYRAGPYEPMNAKTLFSDPAQLKMLREKFFAVAQAPLLMSDVPYFTDFIAAQKDARKGKIGMTGYCMGGRMSMLAAGTYPESFVAAAAFHPSGLATDAPDSPHLLVPKMKAEIYVGGATEDQSFPPEMRKKFDDALTEAHVKHEVLEYPAKHGWVFTDTPVYDKAQSDRHYDALKKLFDATLIAS